MVSASPLTRSSHHAGDDFAKLRRRARHGPAELAMPRFSSNAGRITRPAMFDLVADIERYPEFVPLCRAENPSAHAQPDGTEIVVADMTVSFKLVREILHHPGHAGSPQV